MLLLGLLTKISQPSSLLIRRHIASLMSSDNDYNAHFKSPTCSISNPQLRKRKHVEKLTLETDSIEDKGAAFINLKVISNGYLNNVKSFMLVTVDQNYLVNAGESSLRVMRREDLKASKIENVLMTRANWESCGGLASLTLELGNQNRKTPLCLHSPIDWDLSHNMKLTRCLVDQSSLHVKQFDYNKKGKRSWLIY